MAGWRRCLASLAAGLLFISGATAQEAVRPEIGRPLQAARDLVKAQRFKEALAKVREAETAGARSAHESALIERMRLAAASGAGEADVAARSFEALDHDGQLAAAERLRLIESIAGAHYRSADYARALQWSQRYFREGGSSPAMRTLLIQSQYLGGDYAGATRELTVEIRAAERAGSAPSEDRLTLLLNAASKAQDSSAYALALEKLVTYHPKRQYWIDLLGRLQAKPNFADRLAIDVYRLSLATGSLSTANDYMEMAQLALQGGFAAEARQVLDKGYASRVLGAGPQAERQKRLRDLVAKRLDEEKQSLPNDEKQAIAAKDGQALVNVGLNWVFNGQAGRGLPLMEQAMAQGGLKRPDDARLHLGIAYLLAGDSAKAQAAFKTVGGGDGTGDLARLWMLLARGRA